jgi:DNA-binding LacI/PurR family transcriptional regulator
MVDDLAVSFTKETMDFSYFQKLIEDEFPIVFFNRISSLLNASCALFDDYKWAFFATEH